MYYIVYTLLVGLILTITTTQICAQSANVKTSVSAASEARLKNKTYAFDDLQTVRLHLKSVLILVDTEYRSNTGCWQHQQNQTLDSLFWIDVAINQSTKNILPLTPKIDLGSNCKFKIAEPFSVDSQREMINKRYLFELSIAQRILAEAKTILGDSHPQVALWLLWIAYIYERNSNLRDAVAAIESAVTILTSYKFVDSYHEAKVLHWFRVHEANLGGRYSDDLKKSIAVIQKSATKRGEIPSVSPGLRDVLADVETISNVSPYEKVLNSQITALSIYERTLGPDHPETAVRLNDLSVTYSELAQHEKALPLQLRALSIREKVLGAWDPATATSLGNLATIYRDLGQYENALSLQLRALDIYEKGLGPAHPDTAVSLNNLAETYRASAQYDKALSLQLRALSIREKAFGVSHPVTAVSLNNLASTYRNLADYENALPLQLRALDIYEKGLGPNHPDTAVSLNNLAETYSDTAQYERALPMQLRALAIREAALGPSHPATGRTWSNLSLTFQRLEQTDAAISLLKQAVNIYQTQRERVSTIGKAELQSYSASIEANYQVLATWLTDQGRLAEAQQVLDMLKEDEQFDFVRRSSTADPRRTRMGYTPTEAKWMTRYRQVADQLGALGAEEQALQKQAKPGLTPAQQARLKAIKDDLAVANKAFTSFLDEMQKGFTAQGSAKAVELEETSAQTQRELQTLIRQLGPDVALLQYYVTPDKVGIILTTPGVVLPFSSVVDAKVLNRQIRDYRDMLRNSKSNPLPASQALYQLLVAPVAQALEQAGIKTVMLSLDGNLRQLPFGALHDGKQYLAQRWSLPMYTTVTRDKLRDAVTPRWKAAGLGVTRALGEFKALPAVKRELDNVLRATASSGAPGEVYLDEQFTASRLKDVGQRSFQLMHVSSHFQLSPGTEVNSFLLLGDGQHLTLGDIRTQNYRFDQVDLLTLSACDTGLGGGRDTNGKEIEGLGVIAQQQGAKAVLATLWPVADQSTSMLMADMYQRRQQQTLSKIEALRQAQLALMAQPKYAHPFFWAPFILMGNWK